jgi:hypothetical protein
MPIDLAMPLESDAVLVIDPYPLADSVNFQLRKGELPLQSAETWLSREINAEVKLQHAHGDRFTASVNGSPQKDTVQIKVHMKRRRTPITEYRGIVPVLREPATHAYVLLKEVGKKRWLYLDGKGGEAETRVRAARYPIEKAAEIAQGIMDDNKGTWEAKVLPIEEGRAMEAPETEYSVGDTVTLPAGTRIGMGRLQKPVQARIDQIQTANDGSPFYGVSWTDAKSGRVRTTWWSPRGEA